MSNYEMKQHDNTIFSDADADNRKHFEWAQPSDPGVFAMISKEELNIDDRYQREKVSDQKVDKIAKNLDWRFFGAISVMQRTDGTYWIFDGGHRYRASKSRPDIKRLPCMVFQSDELADEAKAFIGTNTATTAVNAYFKMRAGVQAGEPIAIETESIIKDAGFYPCKNWADTKAFAGVAGLSRIVALDAATARAVFNLCAEMAQAEDRNLQSAILTGLFVVARKCGDGVLEGAHRQRLLSIGMESLEAAVRRKRTMVGSGGDKVTAQAIVDQLNYRRRTNTLSLDGDAS